MFTENIENGSTRSKTRKIALFVPSMRGGGAERVTLILARELALRGYSVDLLLAQAEGPYLREVDESVRIVDFKASQILTSLPALVRYLRSERPEALLSVQFHANIAAVLGSRLARVNTRVVVSERLTVAWRTKEANSKYGHIWRWLIKSFYPWADAIVAVSNGVADDLAQWANIPREDIRTIYNPIVRPEIHEKARLPLDHPWFEPNQPPVVLAVGRLTSQKDFPTLIRAFAQVRKVRPARLLILGEGKERPVLESLIQEVGLEEDVMLPGFVANPYRYMARAAAFVLSSRREGLPGVLIEALTCGTPLIATDCPSGPREILRDGEYGKLVPMEDVDKLAQAIEMAIAGELPPAPQEGSQPFEVNTAVDKYVNVLLEN